MARVFLRIYIPATDLRTCTTDVHTCISTKGCTYEPLYGCTYEHLDGCTYVHLYGCTYMHLYEGVYIHASLRGCTYLHLYQGLLMLGNHLLQRGWDTLLTCDWPVGLPGSIRLVIVFLGELAHLNVSNYPQPRQQCSTGRAPFSTQTIPSREHQALGWKYPRQYDLRSI
jgi:hypothetical protein